MFESPTECFYELAEQYGVDYVLVSNWEMGQYSIDYPFFRNLTPVFSSGSATLYKVG